MAESLRAFFMPFSPVCGHDAGCVRVFLTETSRVFEMVTAFKIVYNTVINFNDGLVRH
jgi:hypothetical protein